MKRMARFKALLVLFPALCAACIPLSGPSLVSDHRGGPTVRDTALAGWSFVLDAGHGGPERGAPSAVAGNSSEADLNLGVAFFLGGMLEASGARVDYTRRADHAVAPAGTSLRDELRARAAEANRRIPDLFISIHHNAGLRPDANRVEVYHNLFSQGPAEDLAVAVAQELGQLYPVFETRVIAGNFAVLRQGAGEGILVECAYLSDRRLAPELEKLGTLKREAAAIHEGIRAWSRGGAPRIVVEEGPDAWTVTVTDHQELTEIAVAAVDETGALETRHAVTGDSWTGSVPVTPLLMVRAVNRSGTTADAWHRATAFGARSDTRARYLVLLPADAAPVPKVVEDSARVITFGRVAATPRLTLRAVEFSPPDYLVIVEPAATTRAAHYFRSPTGERLARALVGTTPPAAVTAGAGYYLNHTSMPAVILRTPLPIEALVPHLVRSVAGFAP